MNKSKYKIAIIVTWFGKLPPYFDAWLISAERNETIDFLIFTDCEVCSNSDNIHVHYTTLNETIKYFEKKLGRKISISNSYKFCDCRPFFGLTYADYIKDYDFWGYCDIDLVFGNIRSFLTDSLLDKYDRFYQYGHLSIFRNTSKMNHLYDIKGGIYSYDEIFCGKAKTTPEEHFGINRICELNHIKWYTNIDFADFAIKYPNRLEVKHGLCNYSKQLFAWDNGTAFRLYEDNGILKKQKFIYMHWQKRKPSIEGIIESDNNQLLLILPNKIVVEGEKNLKSIDELFEKNPEITLDERNKYKKNYMKKKIKEFINSDMSTKKIWCRQKMYNFTTKRSYK